MGPQQRIVGELVGQKCTEITNPYGSIVMIDFGPMAHPEGEPPDALRGWRQLTVYSPWRVESPQEVAYDWNVDGGAAGLLPALVQSLVGQHVIDAETQPPAWDLVVSWSDGTRLVVFGDSTSHRDSAWFVLGIDGECVSADPVVRAPG